MQHVTLQVVLMPSGRVIFRNIGYWSAQSLRMSAPQLFANSKETAHVRTPRRFSPPNDELPPSAAPKMGLVDMKGTPATMSLDEEIYRPIAICRTAVGNRIV